MQNHSADIICSPEENRPMEISPSGNNDQVSISHNWINGCSINNSKPRIIFPCNRDMKKITGKNIKGVVWNCRGAKTAAMYSSKNKANL